MADQDNYSDIPKEVPPENDAAKDPERMAAGYKATISNPQTSDQAKSNAKSALKDMGEPEEAENTKTKAQEDKDPSSVARGLKASINNPGVSDEAKQNAKEKLEKQ